VRKGYVHYEALGARWDYQCLYRDYMGEDYELSNKDVATGDYMLDLNRYETAVEDLVLEKVETKVSIRLAEVREQQQQCQVQ
jgi:hypothetical protein